jgi:excisionase family DNA binding protein
MAAPETQGGGYRDIDDDAASNNRIDTTPPPGTPTMTATEASEVLKVSRTTVQQWARRGRIYRYRKHGQWRYLRSQVIELAARINPQ